MSKAYTFSLTVQDLETHGVEITPEVVMEYIRMRLESHSVLSVLNLVRDY